MIAAEMAEIANSRFLRLPRKLLTACGIWNVEFESGLQKFFYTLYHWICVISCYGLSSIHSVAIIIFLYDENWDFILDQIGISFSLYNCCIKAILLNGEVCKKMNERILKFEQSISDDRRSKIIYKDYLSFTEKIIRLYVSMVFVTLIFLVATPFFQRAPTTNTNGTIASGGKRYMTSLWYPIDTEEHLFLAWVTETWMMLAISMIFVFSDVLYFSLTVCSISQLKILQHKLKNITSYSSDLAKKEKIPLADAQYLTIENCILLHRQTIETMHELNKMLKTFLLFEYTVSSMKISLLLINILWRSPVLLTYIVFCLTVCSLSVELYLYYWNVNEVLLESSDGIYHAIALSDWYELDKEVQKRLLFILMRAKYPLTLSIGPFYTMTLDALIKVLKACYCYLSLVGQFSNRDR